MEEKRPFQCPIQWAHVCAVKQTNNTTGATIDTWTHHIYWYRWFSALGHDTPNRRMMQDRMVVKTQFWAGLRQACSQGSTSSGQWGIDIRYHRCADLCFLLFLISNLGSSLFIKSGLRFNAARVFRLGKTGYKRMLTSNCTQLLFWWHRHVRNWYNSQHIIS